MVSYQTWTSLCFDVAEQKGAEFENLRDGGGFISNVVAELWARHKAELQTATRAEARQLAERKISA